MGDFRFLFLGCWSHLKLWRVEGKSTRLWLLCGLCVQLVSVKNILIWSMCNLITSILEKGTPLVIVDILIFSSEISFLSFFTSSIVWHLFCTTRGLNHTSGWAENFPQFRDQLSYELATAASPGLVFHTEPSPPGSCSYPGISTTAGGGVLGRLRSSTLSPSSSTPRRSRGVLELGRGVLELKLHEEESKYTEA